ncbi:alpha/beta hydrolase [Streptomyces decoyicus]|uniref:alpha/beta hydrolase n=1 Tax=Streptomyces decoyicus TaxID=249567 RepID=UPI002E366897|nr:alpha/beta fold hydrolase [Streptomyces decoyicus]
MTGTSQLSPHHEMPRSFTIDCDGETLSCAAIEPLRTPTNPRTPLAAVVLHGAGTSDKTRHTALMADFAARGHHALACDFSGHGNSTGQLGELSLQRRFRQARAVIDHCVPAGSSLALIGFSMSGQTVADHRLGSWLADNSVPRSRFVAAVLRGTPYERTPPPPRLG